jgi:hypothetical protein
MGMRPAVTRGADARPGASAPGRARPEMAERYSAGSPVLDWRDRLVCSWCGGRAVRRAGVTRLQDPLCIKPNQEAWAKITRAFAREAHKAFC